MSADAVTVLLWALGIIIVIETGVIVAMFFMYNGHVQDCKEHKATQVGRDLVNAVEQGKMMEKIDRIERNIGDHDSGMTAQLHRYSKDIRDLTQQVVQLNRSKTT